MRYIGNRGRQKIYKKWLTGLPEILRRLMEKRERYGYSYGGKKKKQKDGTDL